MNMAVVRKVVGSSAGEEKDAGTATPACALVIGGGLHKVACRGCALHSLTPPSLRHLFRALLFEDTRPVLGELPWFQGGVSAALGRC